MRAGLPDDQWDAVEHGEVTGPDGTRYVRSSTRAKRRDCDRYLDSGAPLVLYYWGGRQLDWYDGDDALAAWQQARSAVTQTPRYRGDDEWTAGVWTSDGGQRLVLLTGHC